MDIDDNNGSSNAMKTAPDPAFELRRLAAALYRVRTSSAPEDGSDELDELDPAALLHRGLQHFAASRTALRKTASSNKADKASVAAVRQKMDTSYLALQNKMYEISHLYREIDRCNDYDSIYQDVPLVPEDEFLASIEASKEDAMEEEQPEGSTKPEALSEDPHERMVARLKHEVAERQRAQAQLKQLLASKTKVIKETEIRKASLEQLEKQLDEFVASAKAIQDKFSKM